MSTYTQNNLFQKLYSFLHSFTLSLSLTVFWLLIYFFFLSHSLLLYCTPPRMLICLSSASDSFILCILLCKVVGSESLPADDVRQRILCLNKKLLEQMNQLFEGIIITKINIVMLSHYSAELSEHQEVRYRYLRL